MAKVAEEKGYVANSLPGWMGVMDQLFLYVQAKKMSSVVEIGSWMGRSTHALLTGCPGPVFAIDHFQGNPDENGPHGPHHEAQERDIFLDFWQNVGHFKNLVVFRMPSVEAAKFFADQSVDMVFIDGYHAREAVKADILAWRPKCRRLLCGHDAGYTSVGEAIRDCGYEVNTAPDTGIWRIEFGATGT